MFTAFLDANVLVPVVLTDTILRCAERELFRPLWSEQVLDEARQAILLVEPHLSTSRVDYRINTMRRAFREAVVTGYEVVISEMCLPDPDDRHVVAAAYQGGADLIVTGNLKHFPKSELSRFGLEAVNADCFLQDLLDLDPVVVDIIASQAADTRNPPLSVEDILISIGRAGAHNFVHDVRKLIERS